MDKLLKLQTPRVKSYLEEWGLEMRAIALGGVVSIALLSVSCSALTGGDGWSYSEKRDEAKNVTISKAEKQFASSEDKSAITQVSLVCTSAGSGHPETNLVIQVLSLQDNKGDKYEAAHFVEVPVYRLDNMQEPRLFSGDKSKYVNEIAVPFFTLFAPDEMMMRYQLHDLMIAITDEVGWNLPVNDNMFNELRSATKNFKYPTGGMHISYEAEGGSSRNISFSLEDKSLVKVAEACGWSRNPKSPPAPPPAEKAEAAPTASVASTFTSDDGTTLASPEELPQTAGTEPAQSQVAATPSFDCSKATAAAEKIICRSPRLIGLDRQLAELTQRARQGGLIDSAWAARGREWIRQRNACVTEDCIAEAYGERIDFVAVSTEEEPN